MRVLVCGGREFGEIMNIKDRGDVKRALEQEMFFNMTLRAECSEHRQELLDKDKNDDKPSSTPEAHNEPESEDLRK